MSKGVLILTCLEWNNNQKLNDGQFPRLIETKLDRSCEMAYSSSGEGAAEEESPAGRGRWAFLPASPQSGAVARFVHLS